MEVNRFFYRVFRVNSVGEPLAYLGTAFPVAPGGGLLTCRHVVDVELRDGEHVAVYDSESDVMRIQTSAKYPPDPSLDVAYLPGALQRSKPEYLPIIEPSEIKLGEDVYSFGYFATSAAGTEPEQGCFKGHIINAAGPPARPQLELTLSYPVIEGLSGAPVLTYHHGPKIVGLAFGSLSSRILASEVVEYDDSGLRLRETVNRIVEFGLAYQPGALIPFLRDLNAAITVSSARVAIPGLE